MLVCSIRRSAPYLLLVLEEKLTWIETVEASRTQRRRTTSTQGFEAALFASPRRRLHWVQKVPRHFRGGVFRLRAGAVCSSIRRSGPVSTPRFGGKAHVDRNCGRSRNIQATASHYWGFEAALLAFARRRLHWIAEGAKNIFREEFSSVSRSRCVWPRTGGAHLLAPPVGGKPRSRVSRRNPVRFGYSLPPTSAIETVP